MSNDSIHQVAVALRRDEVVTTEPTITFECPPDVASDDVERCAAVRGADGSVTATRRAGMFRWRPRAPLAPGRHVFVVEQLAAGKGSTTAPVEVPFVVVASNAKIPDRLRIESFRRVAVTTEGSRTIQPTERATGRYIDFIKAEDRRTGRPVSMSFDQSGKAVDGDEILAKAAQRIARRTDGLHPALHRAIEGARGGDDVLVDVWADLDEGEPAAGDRPLHEGDIESSRRRAAEERLRCKAVCDELVERLGDIGKVVDSPALAPVVTMHVAAGRVRELAAVMTSPASTCTTRARSTTSTTRLPSPSRAWSTRPAKPARHRRRRVGARSDQQRQSRDRGSVQRQSDHERPQSERARDHSEQRADTPDGHAPGCNLHSANSTAGVR